MKTKITIIILAVLACSACKTNGSKNRSQSDSITVNSGNTGLLEIDITKEYPAKRISLQEIADIEYIQLEKKENIIPDRIRYISDSIIIAIEYKRGDIITFSGDGKFISKFNKKGRSGEEYQSIGSIAYSPEDRELFITDYLLLHRIQVYSIDGLYRRTLNHPPGAWIKRIYNFDSETLLAYEDPDDNARKKDNEIFTPYLFISKKDGSIVSKVNISFKKEDRISAIKVKSIDKYKNFQITIPQTNIVESNGNYIIGDLSVDTIFMVKNDKSITPIVVKNRGNNPDPNLLPFLVYKNDKYSFFTVIDFNLDLDTLTNLNNPKIDSRSLLYNASDGQINEITLYNEDYPENDIDIDGIGTLSQKGYAVYSIEAYKLVDAYKKENLKGELKAIASKLTDDDNRVLVKVIFK